MADFSKDISNFQNYGTYNYQLDEAGNELLVTSSSVFQQNFFAFPLSDLNYDQSKILSFYDPTFMEFVKPISSSVSSALSATELAQQLASAQTQNAQLSSQLNTLISANEQASGSANQQVIKDIILGLRIQLGQGTLVSDFSTTFPYSPLPADQQPSQGGFQ